jgi:hypothetical protein
MDSARISKTTQRVSITSSTWLRLFKEVIAAYSDQFTKLINNLGGQSADLLIVE